MSEALFSSAQCQCKGLSIRLKNPPAAQLVCHCQDCRTISGRAFTSIAFFKPDDAEVSGATTVQTMNGGSGLSKSYFSCKGCGQFLYATVSVLKGMVGVEANDIAPPFEFKPICHVWASEKTDETVLPANLPVFPKGPPVAPHRL